MMIKKIALAALLILVAYVAYAGLSNTVITGKILGMTEQSTLGSYQILHGILCALVLSPLLAIPLFLKNGLRDLTLTAAFAMIFFMGLAGHRMADISPASQLEYSDYETKWSRHNAI
ncbi:MAG: hypothetical protein RPU34_02220 [Candidatus Sedimenticola sp. (ex Thyasira tokunagai)]